MSVSKNINVAVIGLGHVGSSILEKLLKYDGKGVTVICAVEHDVDAPGIAVAKAGGINVFENGSSIIELGDKVDVVFDFTDNLEARSDFVMAMAKSRNNHTAIIPPIVAHFVWNLLERVL